MFQSIVNGVSILGRSFGSKKVEENIIYESFKTNGKFMLNLEKFSNKDKLNFYDVKNQNTILRFY